MDEFKDKIEGNVKEASGKLTGDHELEAEGKGQQVVGDVEEGGR